MRLTRRALLGTTAATAGAAFAGCTDDSGDGEASGEEAGTPGDGESTTVAVRSHPDHGEILVGPEGLTLYMFDQDTAGEDERARHDDCADSWPPLTLEADDEPTAGADVTAELSTFERADGARQVAAGGWPLYYFAADDEPGDASGQGVNDVWWVLEPDGTPVRSDGDGTDEGDEGEDDGGGDGGGGGGSYYGY